MRDKEVPPDELRCHRRDGKQWRCSRPAMEGKKMCEIHHLQLSLRQHKHKVPESLKLIRGKNKTIIEENKSNGEIRAEDVPKVKKRVKRKRAIGESEALDEVVKKMKLKRGDTQLELIRMVLKKEVNKTENKKQKKEKKKKKKGSHHSLCDGFDESDGEDFRVLPNGVMAISSASPSDPNAAASCDTKVGAEPIAVSRRRFRSKNIEPIPLGSVRGVPYEENLIHLMKQKRKRCHWCGGKNLKNLISCSSFHKHFFCAECLRERRVEEVEMECPVCRRICSCRGCSIAKSKDAQCKDFLRDKDKLNKVLHLHYLICILLPVLKQLNKDQTLEIEREEKDQGLNPCEVKVQTAKSSLVKGLCCNRKVSIEMSSEGHPNCSCNLCLRCSHDLCQQIFQGNLGGCIRKCSNGKEACIAYRQKKQRHDGMHHHSCQSVTDGKAPEGSAVISCPSEEMDGCGSGHRALRDELPICFTKKLEITAEEIVSSYELPETFDTSSSCSICLGTDNQEAARRVHSMDNFLFRPTIKDFHNDNLEHFQKHWTQGHPVAVRNMLQGASDLCWDPIAMFCTYLKNSDNKSQNDARSATSSSDWFELEIGINQSFVGSFGGCTKTNMCHEKLKLNGWLSSNLFQEQFPAHHSEIITALPSPHYMDKTSGLLNVVTYLPEEFPRPDLGPCVHISYNSGDGIVEADCVTKLCFDFCDLVNVLVHATDAAAPTKHICRIRKLMKQQNAQDQREATHTSNSSKLSSKKREVGLHSDSEDEKHACDRTIKELCSTATRYKTFDQNRNLHAERDNLDLETSKHYSSAGVIAERTENGWFSEQRENREQFENQDSVKSCGVQWDIFRRQDVPKLLEYLRGHAHEFDHANFHGEHESHQLLKQHFFLGASHKLRLKEELGIEPWTFEQHVGEAVIVPAGCPYQIKKMKSCVNVVLNFLSPESVSECIGGTDELLLFPGNHNVGTNKLEAKKMAIHTISAAVKKIRELTGAE